METVRQKAKADKKLLVSQNMQLSEAGATAFWPSMAPIRRTCSRSRPNADAYSKGPVANEAAMKLLNEALAIDEAEVKLKRSYVPRLEKALPQAKVARYIQIENKIRAVVRYEFAANIPLVQ